MNILSLDSPSCCCKPVWFSYRVWKTKDYILTTFICSRPKCKILKENLDIHIHTCPFVNLNQLIRQRDLTQKNDSIKPSQGFLVKNNFRSVIQIWKDMRVSRWQPFLFHHWKTIQIFFLCHSCTQLQTPVEGPACLCVSGSVWGSGGYFRRQWGRDQ